jgi:hypothetical protein
MKKETEVILLKKEGRKKERKRNNAKRDKGQK